MDAEESPEANPRGPEFICLYLEMKRLTVLPRCNKCFNFISGTGRDNQSAIVGTVSPVI